MENLVSVPGPEIRKTWSPQVDFSWEILTSLPCLHVSAFSLVLYKRACVWQKAPGREAKCSLYRTMATKSPQRLHTLRPSIRFFLLYTKRHLADRWIRTQVLFAVWWQCRPLTYLNFKLQVTPQITHYSSWICKLLYSTGCKSMQNSSQITGETCFPPVLTVSALFTLHVWFVM